MAGKKEISVKEKFWFGFGKKRASAFENAASGGEIFQDAKTEICLKMGVLMEAVATETKSGETFFEELGGYWNRLPDKGLFFILLAAWMSLFYFWGTAELNLSKTPSLFEWMYTAWNQPLMDSSHGNLVPFVVIGLLWYKRERLAKCRRGVGWVALPVLALALLLHLFGYLIQQPRLSIVSLFMGIHCLIGLVWGWEAMKATFFPMVLFAFCLPLEAVLDPYTWRLRLFSAKATQIIASDALSIRVMVDGTVLRNSHGDAYEVVAACSGIRSLLALLGITIIYAVLNFKSLWKGILIVLLTIPIAIACNVLRLVVMIIAAEAVGPRGAHFVHEWFGFVTYMIALGCVMLVGRLLGGSFKAPKPAPARTPAYGAI